MQSDMDSYEVRIKRLEDETARYSEQSLLEQEQRVLASLREITQNVVAMDQESSLVELKGSLESQEKDELVIDPSKFQEKIDTFVELVELLKVSHLEQETLDTFLRYTISSSNLLQLDSVQDARYVEVESQVRELEQGTLESHKRQIEATKGQINKLCQELTTAQDSVNEIFLDTSNSLEECDAFLDELTQLRMEKQTSEEADTVEDDPVSQTYEDWKSLKKSQTQLELLQNTTSNVKSRIQSYEDFQKRSRQANDPKLLQAHKTLELLIQLWVSKFLPQSGISNLELYPQTRKFQFDIQPTFTVVITLADQATLNDIQIRRKKTANVVEDIELSNELKEKYLGTNNIHNTLNDIIHTLQEVLDN